MFLGHVVLDSYLNISDFGFLNSFMFESIEALFAGEQSYEVRPFGGPKTIPRVNGVALEFQY